MLVASHGRAWAPILLHQFKSLIVLLLLASTSVAFLLGGSVEAAAIMVVVVNAGVGFLIEWKAEHLFSCNAAEILVVFAAIMVGWPLPLAPQLASRWRCSGKSIPAS